MAQFYRVVRVRPNGSELVLRDIPFANATDELQRRAEAFADAGTRIGQHIRLYSSQDDGTVTRDDCIWDSEVNR